MPLESVKMKIKKNRASSCSNQTQMTHWAKISWPQGSKLAGARVHGASRNLAVHPSFKSWVHAVHPVISAQWQTNEADCTHNDNNNLEHH